MAARYIKKYKNNSCWMVSCPYHRYADSKGYVKEHRFVMEAELGRFLSKEEIVHHIDGNGLNNKIENLELTTKSKHAKHHRYWKNSPREGNTWAQKEYNKSLCNTLDCNKPSKANGYCSNHNRDNWRRKRRERGLAYT